MAEYEFNAHPNPTVLAELFGTSAASSAAAFPITPLDAMYTGPAQAFIERHGYAAVRACHRSELCGDGAAVRRQAEAGPLYPDG